MAKQNAKLKVVKSDKFNLTQCGAEIAEDIIRIQDAESARASLNKHLGEAYAAGVKWGRATQDGTLGAVLTEALKKRGLADNTLRVTLCTLKFCFENKVRVDSMTLSRMKTIAEKGGAVDLITGEPKKVKVEETGKGKGKGKAPKIEKVVKHVGYHMLAAVESEGFLKWLNHFMDAMDIRGIDSTDIDDMKLSLVRDTLRECGFANVNDKGEFTVTLIKESDDEAEEV